MLCCCTLYKKAYAMQEKRKQTKKKNPQNKTKINREPTPEIAANTFCCKPATHKLILFLLYRGCIFMRTGTSTTKATEVKQFQMIYKWSVWEKIGTF